MANSKSRLGRGLSGLITGGIGSQSSGDSKPPSKPVSGKPSKKPVQPKKTAAKKRSAPPAPELPGYAEIPVGKIDQNPFQPRREFDAEQLRELAESIRSEGLLQPIVVRKSGGRFQLIAGERRWRACKNLQLKTIPARIIEATDASSASISLIENLQRAELNPVEESLGYASLIRDFDLTQEEVAERVGKGRATVANALRLLQLNSEVRGYLGKGMISVGHAKLLLGIEEEAEQTLLARKIIEEGLSVRAVENLVRNLRERKTERSSERTSAAAAEDSAVKDIEKQLASRLSTRVALKHSAKRGRIVIEYYGNDDLQRILERMGVSN